MYDPTIGRWLTKDPIGFEGGDTNLYRYALNAPTIHADPSGLRPTTVTISLTVGGVSTALIVTGIETYNVIARAVVVGSVRVAVMDHILGFAANNRGIPRFGTFEFPGSPSTLASDGGAGNLQAQERTIRADLRAQSYTQINIQPHAYIFFLVQGPEHPPVGGRPGICGFNVNFRIQGTARNPAGVVEQVDASVGSFRGEFSDARLETPIIRR